MHAIKASLSSSEQLRTALPEPPDCHTLLFSSFVGNPRRSLYLYTPAAGSEPACCRESIMNHSILEQPRRRTGSGSTVPLPPVVWTPIWRDRAAAQRSSAVGGMRGRGRERRAGGPICMMYRGGSSRLKPTRPLGLLCGQSLTNRQGKVKLKKAGLTAFPCEETTNWGCLLIRMFVVDVGDWESEVCKGV